LEILEGRLEHVHAGLPGAGFHEVHRAVENVLRGGLLAFQHQRVDELGDGLAVVARIRQNRALDGFLTAAHFLPPAAAPLGFLVPYFDRLLLRPLTPDASSDPRTM